MPSEVAARATTDSMLLISFMVCAWPASRPTRNGLPKIASSPSTALHSASGQATISASVPFSAPARPPLTGESTKPIPAAARPRATSREVRGAGGRKIDHGPGGAASQIQRDLAHDLRRRQAEEDDPRLLRDLPHRAGDASACQRESLPGAFHGVERDHVVARSHQPRRQRAAHAA